ncbi:uncharacterized protein LOC125489975 [Plutella xylostella]|uniref:uncharacterized protein LOC125489975 n=1 Tax=Plutella xylostella TaxID=51655 RepID=UPI00203258FD|nr:uncharacterized protein LOC125489975 [Plutella xylostella]
MDCNTSGVSGATGTKVVTRKYLFDQIQGQNLPSFSEKLDYYEEFLLFRYGDTENDKKSFKKIFSYVKTELKKRWTKANKHKEVFLKNQDWLEGTFEIPIESRSPQGRPPKSFEDLSEHSKRRKTKETLGPDVVVHAAQSVLQCTGHRDASKVHKEIPNSPTRASTVNNDDEVSPPLTPLQALQMYVEADLSRRQYEIIRATNPKHFPSYVLLVKAKKECQPPE